MISFHRRQLAAWSIGILIAGIAGWLALRPDPYDALRQGDTLFAAGHYRAALNQYAALANVLSEADLRRGIVLTVRGETDLARRAFAAAIQTGLRPAAYQLAVLYLGQIALLEGDPATARRTWQTLTTCLPNRCAIRDLLLADDDLRSGRFDAAFAVYQSVATDQLPADWAAMVGERLTLLNALHNPNLETPVNLRASVVPADPFLRPLLPPRASSETLSTALIADPAARPQLLGQLALELGYDHLALAFFAQVDPAGAYGLSATIYQAYAHLRLGNQQQGIVQLEQLAAAHPDDVRIGALLAVAYTRTGDLSAAAARLQQIQAQHHTGPAIALVQAGLAFAQRDFVAVADAYEQAVITASPDERGRYLTLAARFHLDSGFERCSSGILAAQAAVNNLPTDPEALTILAGTRYYCGDLRGALAAADAALTAGGGVEARFYYGLILCAQGDLSRGRAALEAVADQAPASIWRQRAETALELLGM